VRNFWRDDNAQDIAEYAVLLSIMLCVVIAVISAVGANASTLFSRAGNTLSVVGGK
jgi:Flp pilus assembly pilin Flp